MHSVFVVQWCLWIWRTILRPSPPAARAPRLLLSTCPVHAPHILRSRPRRPSRSVLTCSSCRARGLRCWALVVSAAGPRHLTVNRKEVRDKRPWAGRTVWSKKDSTSWFYSYLEWVLKKCSWFNLRSVDKICGIMLIFHKIYLQW